MAEIVIDANEFNSFYKYVGSTGENDTITVNIGEQFGGTITIAGSASDREFETVIFNLPEGWKLVRTSTEEETTSEEGATLHYGYQVVDAENNTVGTIAVHANDIRVTCFARDTLIETSRGSVAIQDLAVGDLVLTRDHGAQPVQWIGATRLNAAALARHENLRPIRIRAGALGAGLPASDLVVSPQHRVLVRSRIAQRMFGTTEVLVAAKQLLGLPGIGIASDLAGIEYFHMLFERHEIVISNGADTESLYPGREALKSVGPAALQEILTLFPELADLEGAPDPARPLPPGRQGRRLAQRHAQNELSLVN